MEVEGSCTQLDAVGLVVLKGLSLSASTRENHSSFCDLSVTLQNKLNTKQSSIHYTVLKTRQLGNVRIQNIWSKNETRLGSL
jgi:hypothetical protein